MSLKEKWQSERDKLKNMSWKKKLGYIWEYYKLWIIGTLVFTLFAYSMISSQIKNSRPTYLFASFINSTQYQKEDFDLMNDFANYAGVDMKKEQLTLDTTLEILPDKDYAEVSYNSTMKLFAQVAANSIDVIVLDPDNLSVYAKEDAFLALDETLPADLYTKLKNHMLEAQRNDGTPYECGIDISDSVVLHKSQLYSASIKPVFTIVSNSKHIDNAITFLKYLYSENNN